MGNWNNSDDVIRIFNEDCTGRKLFKATAQVSDTKAVANAFRSIISKYGMPIKIELGKNKDDLEFLKEDEEFKF